MDEQEGTRTEPRGGRAKRYLVTFAKLYVFVNSAAFCAGFALAIVVKLG